MATGQRESLTHYLALSYPYTVVNDEGSFFIEFPDLPGCMAQVEDARDIAVMAEEIRTLWIETEYERGADIPESASTTGHSGQFVMRVPKPLHRTLVQSAKQEGMGLNAYVLHVLSERQVVVRGELVTKGDVQFAADVGDKRTEGKGTDDDRDASDLR